MQCSDIICSEKGNGWCEAIPTDIETCRDFLIRYPWHCDAWHQLGQFYEEKTEQEQAIEAYSEAIAIAHRYHPIIHFEHAAICYHLGLWHYEAGEPEKAAPFMKQAIFQDHNHAPALKLQAEGWQGNTVLPAYDSHIWLMRDRERELRRSDLLPEAMPLSFRQHDKAISLWQQGNATDACSMLKEICITVSDIATFHFHYACVLDSLNDREAAFQALYTALIRREQQHKNYHRGASLHYLHRAMAHHAIGEAELAMMDALRAADIDVTHTEAEAYKQFLKNKKNQ